jgi:CheY-like chemotaxis protein
MVYGFVKQSKGHVNISSTPAVGTTVRVYLPKTEAAPRLSVATDTEPFTAADGTGQCILVVEDEPAVRALVVKGLHSLGYRTLDAPDARTALAMLSSAGQVDLLLTDVVLPGGQNGPELARRVQAMRSEVPVLFMSGYAEHAMTQGGRIAADVALLEKPFSRQQLAQAVRAAIAHPENHASP